MFDIGWSELLVIAVVAIVVVGPKELPKLMRSFGFYAGKLRRAAAEFRRQFDDAMREAELEEVKKAIESVRTETRALDEKAPLDRPLMVEKAETAAARPRPPRRSRRRRRRANAPRRKPRRKPSGRQARQERRGARAMSDDDIEASKAPLIEHLIELRRRLMLGAACDLRRLSRVLLVRQAHLQSACSGHTGSRRAPMPRSR